MPSIVVSTSWFRGPSVDEHETGGVAGPGPYLASFPALGGYVVVLLRGQDQVQGFVVRRVQVAELTDLVHEERVLVGRALAHGEARAAGHKDARGGPTSTPRN
jgi:hypothetical protein